MDDLVINLMFAGSIGFFPIWMLIAWWKNETGR